MARQQNKICLFCQGFFRGRADAKTCSEACRKRLQRVNQNIQKVAVTAETKNPTVPAKKPTRTVSPDGVRVATESLLQKVEAAVETAEEAAERIEVRVLQAKPTEAGFVGGTTAAPSPDQNIGLKTVGASSPDQNFALNLSAAPLPEPVPKPLVAEPLPAIQPESLEDSFVPDQPMLPEVSKISNWFHYRRQYFLAALTMLILASGAITWMLSRPTHLNVDQATSVLKGTSLVSNNGLADSGLGTQPGESLHLNLNTEVDNGKQLSSNGAVLLRNQQDSLSALNVQDAAGSSLLVVDTLHNRVGVGGAPAANNSAALQVSGDISAKGKLIISGGSTSLSSSGLSINGILVCNVQGCINSSSNPGNSSALNTANLAKLNNDQSFSGNNTFTGDVIFQNAVSGSNNFDIQNAGGSGDLFMVDTVATGKIGIGRTPLSTTPAILQINGSEDLTGQITFNGNQINTYNLADSANIARLNTNQTFTGNNSFTNSLSALNLQPASGTLTVGAFTASLDLQGDFGSQLIGSNGTFNTTIGFSGTPTGNVIYDFDSSATPGSYSVCTTVGNCVGSNGAVATPGGSSGYLAKFTGIDTIADSSILDNGLTVSVGLPAAFRAASNSTTAFRVQNSAGLEDLIVADTTDSRVGISLSTGNVPQYPLDVVGDINSSSGLRVGGNLVCTSSGCVASNGSGFYIENGTATQGANFNIQSAAVGSVVAVLQGASGQSADLLDIKDGNSNKVLSLNSTGSVLVQPSINSTTAFQIQNAAGNSNLLVADTADSFIGIGKAVPAYTLDVNGDINISTGSFYRINGVSICGPQATCAPSAGSSYYIQNANTLQTGANFNISSININYITGVLRGAIGQVADILDLQDGNGNTIFTEGAGGSILAKTTTNSTTAFQIQNSAGTSNLFVADTADTRIGIGTAAPTTTLDVNGTSLFQAPVLGSSNSLTVSGNEITDATRTSNTQGDGVSPPDSSYGIWEGTTNLESNGGLESNLNGWTSINSATVTRDSTHAKFGSWAMKISTPGVVTNEGSQVPTANYMPVTAGSTYTASMWVYSASGGEKVNLNVDEFNSGQSYVDSWSGQAVTLVAGWQRLTRTNVVSASIAYLAVSLRTITTVQAITVWADGIQLEQNAYATPYVETNGSTATRAAARVQAPTTLVGDVQGWAAFRYRPDFASSSPVNHGSTFETLFDWVIDNNDRITAFYNQATNTFELKRGNNGTFDQLNSSSTYTFNSGNSFTVIYAWTATQLLVSVNGSSFATLPDSLIPIGTTPNYFDIGSNGGLSSQWADGDILWAATGTGTLTNTDATNINSFGNTDPNINSFAGTTGASMVWQSNNAAYQYSGYNPIVFQVQNSSGSQLLGADANASAILLPNATSSTAALILGGDSNTNLYRSAASTLTTSATFQAVSGLQAPSLDTLTAAALNVGTTNATAINLNQNTVVASGKSLTVNGTASFQNSVNSTNAFAIQNAAGTSNLFIADTADSRLGVATALPLTTFDVSGTSLLQGASNSANNLTVSGNEITDATRTVNQQGDGRAAPDSSYGIWEGTTNLETNGGFESNATGWGNVGSATVTQVTSTAKFGAGSLQVVDTGANAGAANNSDPAISAATTYTNSAWVKGNSGRTAEMVVLALDSGNNSLGSFASTTFTFNGSWQRVTATGTSPANTAKEQIRIDVAGDTGQTFFIDGVQLEQKAAATPYVETNGATASRSAARVQAPASLVNSTQGWFSARVRMGFASTQDPNAGSATRIMAFTDGNGDTNGRIELLYTGSSQEFNLFRSASGNNSGGRAFTTPQTFSAGTIFTVVGYWTSTTVAISVNGGSFTTASNNLIPPNGGGTYTIELGEESAGVEFDGDILWAASGTGTLTNTDANSINNFGNTDPYTTNFSQAAYPTMVWHANNGTYQTGSSLALQVQNSSGNNLLAVDSASAAIKVQASAKLQNLTDSTNALTVTNAAGTQLFNVNTSNLQVSAANLQSSGSVNIVNSQGSISLSPGINSPNGLTVSGNEITDAERTIGASATNYSGQSYDGKLSDSSYGIWEATTNLVTNGGFESNATGWSPVGSTSPTRSTAVSKFGSASLAFTMSGASGQGGRYTIGTLTSGTTYTGSAWVYATGSSIGKTINIRLRDDTTNAQQSNPYTLQAGWQRITVSWAPDSSSNTIYLDVYDSLGAGSSWTVNIDGVQLEQKPYATPYVETNGSTATRNAARVQAPASELNATQGWFAIRGRFGFASAQANGQRAFWFGDGTSNSINRMAGTFQPTALQINENLNGGATETAAITIPSWNVGDMYTAIFAWTSTNLYLSYNGGAFTSVARTQIPVGLTTLDIGSAAGSSTWLDGDVLWTAMGTGTLTANDAATLNSLGNTDPTYASLMNLNKGSAAPTFVWNGSTAAYQDSTSSNGDSLIYAANTSSSLTGNLIDLQSGSVSASKFSVDTSGNVIAAGSLSVGGLSSFSGSTFKPTADSATAFQIQNAGGNSIFNVNSTANQITLGASSATPVTLVVGVSSAATDPTGTNGEVYYNTSMNAFRCYQAGVWVNCIGSGGGGGGGNVSQGGNTFGTGMVLGTNDNYSLSLRTDGLNVETLGTNGSALFQNSADSTTAFQIQNQAGSSNLFVADTTDSRIGIGTASPNSTLSVNGSTNIQQNTATSPQLTVSGNEITDATRTANTQGDGRTPPDSSYGIWTNTTNLLTNGGFESNTTGWSTTAHYYNNTGATLTQDTTTSKFGSASGKVVTPGATTAEGVSFGALSVTSGQAYTFSAWLKGSGTIHLGLGDATVGSQSGGNITLTSTWTRYSLTFTPTATGSTYAAVAVPVGQTEAITYWIDGAQFEQQSIATPYVNTNGSTASRAAANVQAALGSLNGTQGWVSIRVRMGFSSASPPSTLSGQRFFSLTNNGGSPFNSIQGFWSPNNGNKWYICAYVNGASECAFSAVDSFNAGDARTLVFAWTSTTLNVSINGASFVSSTRSLGIPNGISTFNIGSDFQSGAANSWSDSDTFWLAAGTGTLTNTDASSINAFGNSDPGFASFSGPSSPAMTWAANNASYANSAASSTLVFNVQNSSGTNLLGVDAGSNQITATTAALFKNSVNNTLAFQIQNAAGNSLLGVDTVNNLVNLGTTGASGVNGAVVLNSATSSGYGVTLGVTSSQAASYTLDLPTTAPTTGQCLQVDATVASQLDFVTCSGGGGGSTTLQGAYNNSGSPASIVTSSASKTIVFEAGGGDDSTTLFQVQNSSGTAVLDVDTTNGRVGVGTNAPVAKLDVSSGGAATIRGNSTGSNDILDLASNGTNTVTVSSTGAVLAQNSADSTGAFKIQNAAGTSSLFVADTTDSRLGIGTATSVATVNVAGSTLIQQGASTNLTVSGNEITDATRSANAQGDGRAAPDSSEGIWESTTNMLTNGGAESNTTNTSNTAGSGATISRDTTTSKFGSASFKTVTNGSVATGIYWDAGVGPSGLRIAVSPSTTYTFSVWAKGQTGGESMNVLINYYDSSNNSVGTTTSNISLTTSWARYVVTATSPANAAYAIGGLPTAAASTYTYWTDGAQFEQKTYATPYVDTNGSTASRSASQVQAPATVLNATQGWAAVRVRFGVSSTSVPSSNYPRLFDWTAGSSQSLYMFYNSDGGGRIYYSANSSGSWTADAFSAGSIQTIILRWSSSGASLSINGGAFSTPTAFTAFSGSPASFFNIGSQGATYQADSDFLWTAVGTGALTNTDASNLYNFGSTDPNFGQFSGSSNPVLLWHANTAAYQTTGNANVALQVEDNSGSNLLSVDATNAKLTVGTAGLFQNTTNSSNAFEVASSGGTNLFNVNTANLQVTANNLQSSGVIDLANSNGTVSLAGSLQSTGTLTTSGNEINDAERAIGASFANTAGQSYDGKTSDSSYGIWESTTNMLKNGGFEGGTASNDGTFGSGTTTLTQDTTTSKFGSASAKVVTDGTASFQGMAWKDGATSDQRIAVTANSAYTFSFWAKGKVGGEALEISIGWYNSGGTYISGSNTSFTATTSWARYTVTGTAPATAVDVWPNVVTQSSLAATFWVDGAQLEQKTYATPYVETNGATATRNTGQVQAPATNINANQGWVTARVRPAWSAASADNSFGRIFAWGSNSETPPRTSIDVYYDKVNNKFGIDTYVNGVLTGSIESAVQVFNAGDLVTVTAFWTANSQGISINGGSFSTVVRTVVPAISLDSLFNIGSLGSSSTNAWDGDILWIATGTGTLSSTDATNLNGLGSTDPTLAKLYSLNSGAATPTFVWNANTANYQDATSSNGDALVYAANTTGSTGNLIDLQSGAWPSSRFSVSTTGQTLVQTSTNSTTAFQIQNSSGSDVFLADTVNNQVGINTSTPTATLAVNGTGLIEASSASLPTLTTTGNEITDATRTTNTQGDGRAAPDSSEGIWESTTNMVTNGGLESNATGWQGQASATVSRDATTSKFGAASLKVVTPGVASNEGAWFPGIAASSSTTYTISAWVKSPAGAIVSLAANESNSGHSFIQTDLGTATTLTSNWTRLTYTLTTTSNAAYLDVFIYTRTNIQATTFWMDGIQLEQKAYATPYVETNGATATRNAAGITAPSSLLSASQGWFAITMRMDVAQASAAIQVYADWSNGLGQPRVTLVNNGATGFRMQLSNGSTNLSDFVSYSYATGGLVTLVGTWSNSQIGLSVNGSSFTTITNTIGSISIPTSTFRIGYGDSSIYGSSYMDGDVMWFASGTGTLTNTDASNLYNLGNTDPGFSAFPGYSAPSLVWQANNAGYINNGTGSNLVFNVENSNGSSLLNVDTNLSSINLQAATNSTAALTFGNDTVANLYRSTAGTIATSGSIAVASNLNVSGNTKLQTTTNSTTAFQIQNASSSNLLVADTVNSKVGIGAAPSTATTAATFQISGTGSVQAASAASSLTLSGNEITDAERALGASNANTAGQSYDGKTNDGSYGIWQSTTNLVSNGGIESNATGWSTAGSNTVARDTTKAKFGSASLKATYQNNIQLANFNNITVVSGQTYTASVWVYVPLTYNGTQPQLEIDGGTVAIPLATRNQWQRVTVTFTATSNSDNLALIERGSVPSAGQSIWLDGVQVENKAYATPYVETNGGNQTRGTATATAPASLINASQGWVAIRWRAGWTASSQANFLSLFDWRTDSNNRIGIIFDASHQKWAMDSRLGGSAVDAESAVQSFTPGTTMTVVAYWNSTTLAISVNGSAFTTATNTEFVTPTGSSFNIGGSPTAPSDGDTLWFASGTGTLNNSDASAINNLGNADPDVTFFSSQDSSSAPAMAWKANDANYQTNLDFSVQSNVGGSLLSVDSADGAILLQNATSSASALILGRDADFYRSASQTLKTDGNLTVGTNLIVNGTALLQNAVDSTTAFQIQNSGGTTVLGVDTANSRIFTSLVDSASTIGFTLNTPSYVTAGAKLLSVQNNGVEKFSLDKDGNINIASGAQYKINGNQIATSNLADSASIAYLAGSGPQTFTGNNKFTGSLKFQNASDSTSAVQIQNAAGTSNLFVADTTDSRIAVAQASASYTLDVGGDINTTGLLRVNGFQISTASLSDGSNIGLLNANNAFSGNNSVSGSTSLTGTVLAKNTSNSTSSFQIQNSAGSQLLVADTSNMRIYLGNPSGDTTTGTLLVLDNISNSGDPAGVNGAMYYNSTSGKFRCYESGAWTDCLYSSQVAAISSPQNVTSTSYGDVTGLGFNVVTSKNYILQCTLLLSVSGNGGNISMTGPASPTNYTATFQKTSDQNAGDTFTTSSTYDDPNASTAFRVVTSTAGTNKFILTYNAVLNNGSNAGVWQLRARAVDGSSSITFYPTSICNLRPF